MSDRLQVSPRTTPAVRPLVLDATLAVVASGVGALALVLDLGEGGSTPSGPAFAIVALAGLALLARRRHPIAVLGVATCAYVAGTSQTGSDVAFFPPVAIALYTVARAGDRRQSLSIAVGAAAVMVVAVAALRPDSFSPELLGETGQLLLPIAVGDAVRSRADRIRILIDTEATSRVQAERVRIARDLHDVVAHGLSTIAIQSGVAAHLLDRDPGQAKQALEIINATGKSSLEELRAMVGVLRTTDEAPLRPTPTDPDDLSDALDGAADAGIAVTTSTTGRFPADASDQCVVAVHRIVKEALTNVARHAGTASAMVSIHHGDGGVHLSISNAAGDHPPRADVSSTGVGIIGMTERAESLGGSLTAGAPAVGGFEVIATIPYHVSTPGGL